MKKRFLPLLVIPLFGAISLWWNNWFSENIRQSRQVTWKWDIPADRPSEPGLIPNDWFARQKIYPNPGFDHQHYLHALRQAEILHRTSPPLREGWQSAGPYNIGGRITDLAIHPDNPTTMYVAAASGGIFKTTDGGQSWTNVFADAPVIAIGAIAIDPNNPLVLYAGTGESNSSSQSFLGNGIYKTTDGGASWQHIGLEEAGYFGRILVDYSNSQRVFAAACGTLFTPNDQRGIYRSQDGGLTWQQVLFVSDTTAGIDIVQHPTNPDILYAAMWERRRGLTYRRSHGPTSGIYKTTDGGNSWTLLSNGLPTGNEKGRIGLAIARNNPDILYAFIDRNLNGYSHATVYKTTNGGATWSRTNDSALEGMNSTFGWYFGQIRVDPQNDQRIFILGVELWRSDNGGNSFMQLAGYNNINEVYVDHHAMFIHPQTGFIVLGNDGGLYTSNNYGNSWTKINNLPITQFYAMDIDYLNPHRIYGGTQDNNTIRTWNGGTGDWERILGGDGFYTLVDYTNSNTIYAEYQWGNLFRSDDGGSSFNYIGGSWSGERTNWSSPLAMHPQNPNILYFGTYRIWKTTNKGNTWTPVSGDLTRNLAVTGFSTITTIAISRLDPQKILVGTDDGRVHISHNGGISWSEITGTLPVRWITRVTFDPFDVNTIYVTLSGFRWDEPHPHVFRSTNLGLSWHSISGNLPEMPVNVIVADPGRPGQLFVGTDAGVFYTINSGENWWSLSQGIPNAPVTDLKIHHPTRTLVAATYGCSIYKLNLDLLTYISENQPATHEATPLFGKIYPNPITFSRQSLHIETYLPQRAEARLFITDLQGQTIHIIHEGVLDGGAESYIWSGNTIRDATVSPGIYFVNLQSGKHVINRRIVVF